MCCSTALLRFLMVIFNFVIFIAGAATVVIGALVVKISEKGVLEVLNGIKDVPPILTQVAGACYLLIAVGAVLTLLGFLGCCGAYCENKCMLGTFFFIILVMFFVEVIAAIVILNYRPQTEKVLDMLRHSVAENIKKDYGENSITTKAWDNLMALMTCCGYNNYTDFTNSTFVNKGSEYPEQCCSSQHKKCDISNAVTKNADGCFDSVVKLMTTHSSLLAPVAFAVAGVEVILMIMSIILYKK